MLAGALLLGAWPPDAGAFLEPLSSSTGDRHLLLTLFVFSLTGALLLERSGLAVSLLVLGGLLACLVVFPAVFAVVPAFVVLYLRWRRTSTLPPVRARAALAVALALGTSLWLVAERARPPSSWSAERSARAALAEGNRHRALHYARAWRHDEGEAPGEAVLFLAEVALSLGDPAGARALWAEAAARGRDASVKSRAAARLAEAP